MEALPEFTMMDQDGHEVTPSSLKGRPALLYFYPKDDTPGCTREACGIRDRWAQFEAAGIQVYGISKDDAAKHQKFIAKYDLPFPLLTADDATLEAFGVWKEKSMYGRTYWGIARESVLVDASGKVLKHYPKVKPAEHADEILADVQAIA